MTVTNYFLDTEFIDRTTHIELISVALIDQSGNEFYAEVPTSPDPWPQWHQDHVFPNLLGGEAIITHDELRRRLTAFTRRPPRTHRRQFWGYYADYDWVIMCQLFGGMLQLPPSWNKCCYDIKQLAGTRRIKTPKSRTHNALDDARWNKLAYEELADEV